MTLNAPNIGDMLSRAVHLHQSGNLQEAAHLYQLILQQNPEHADALHLLGLIAHALDKNDTAVNLLQSAIKIQPKNAVYHYNIGTIYQVLQHNADAITHYKLCTKFKPEHAEAWANLAVLYHDAEQIALAKQANQQALRVNKYHPSALKNLATLLYQMGEYQDAEKYFDRFLSQYPTDASVHEKKSSIRLLHGDYQRGWQEQAWQYFSSDYVEQNPIRLIPFPKWSGQKLHSGTLLVIGDQGVGDVVMHTSCLGDLLQVAEHIIVECDSRLIPLFKTSFPTIQFISKPTHRDFYWQQALGSIACWINISELGSFFRNSEADFPKHAGYLHVDAAKITRWRDRLATLGDTLKIGISWRGGAIERSRKARSIPLAHWDTLAAIPGVQLINLQYGDHHAEIAEFNHRAKIPLHCFKDSTPSADLEEFAALVSALDLVISVDNTTVHMSGALNVPIWVLLPSAIDWRWLLNRVGSPWYPSMRLYRAETMGTEALLKQLKLVVKTLATSLTDNHIFLREHAKQATKSSASSSANAINLPEQSNYALLLNDTTARYHWGHSCTSLAIHAELRQRYSSVVSIPITDIQTLNPYPTTIEQFDDAVFFAAFSENNPTLVEQISLATLVVINGESTLRGLTSKSISLLYLAYIAKHKLNKRVSLINHSCFPAGETNLEPRDQNSSSYVLYKKVLPQLDYLAVRDKNSQQEFISIETAATLSFDCLPLFIEKQYRPKPPPEQQRYIVIAGATEWGPAIVAEFATLLTLLQADNIAIKFVIGANTFTETQDHALIQALTPRLNQLTQITLARSESEWLHTLEHATLLITGCFHHSIAAAFLGTSFLTLGSKTSDVGGLLKMLNIDALVEDSGPELAQALYRRIQAVLENPQQHKLAENVRQAMLTLSNNNFAGF